MWPPIVRTPSPASRQVDAGSEAERTAQGVGEALAGIASAAPRHLLPACLAWPGRTSRARNLPARLAPWQRRPAARADVQLAMGRTTAGGRPAVARLSARRAPQVFT